MSEDTPLGGRAPSKPNETPRGSKSSSGNNSKTLIVHDEEAYANIRPTGCNLVHPFDLRDDVEWNKELDTFSNFRWAYSKSEIMQNEFRRFQYSSLANMILPIQLWFSTLLFPLFFLGEPLDSPWMVTLLCFGTAWTIILPLFIFAHVRKAGNRGWTNIRVLTDVWLLATSIGVTTFYGFNVYVKCSHSTDPLLGRLGRNEYDYGWTPDRGALYCQQIVKPLTIITILVAPATTNLPPSVLLFYVVLKVLLEASVRPIYYAEGLLNPVEPAGRLTVKMMVQVCAGAAGYLLAFLRAWQSKKQFTQAVKLTKEIQLAKATEDHVDLLLCATVPASALARLANGIQCSDYTPSATVFFSDMVSFTAWSSVRKAEEVVRMLNIMTEAIDEEAVRFNVEKVKTIGDAYWAVTGLPEEMDSHAWAMCQFAVSFMKITKAKLVDRREWGAIQFRIGLHTGPLHGGILGSTMLSYEVFGETSDVASKMEQIAPPGAIVLSEGTYEEIAHMPIEFTTEHDDVEHEGHTFKSYVLNVDAMSARRPSRTHSMGVSSMRVTSFRESPRHGNRMEHYSPSGDSPSSERLNRNSVYSLNTDNQSAHSVDPASAFGPSSSHGTIDPNKAGNAAAGKARRKAFLRQKAAAQTKKSELNDGTLSRTQSGASGSFADTAIGGAETTETTLSHADPETIRQRFTEHKYRFFFQVLKDPIIEKQYVNFALDRTKPFRMWTRVFMLCLPVILLLSIAIEQSVAGTPAPNVGTIVCYFIAMLIAAIDLGLLYVTVYRMSGGTQWPVAHAVLNHLVTVLTLVGAAVNTPGNSVTTNDCSWIGVVVCLLNLFGNACVIPNFSLMLINVFVVMPLIWWACWRAYMFGRYRAIDCSMLATVCFLCATFERQMRQQFLEVELQHYYHTEQLNRVAEQDALLKSIVPEHIAGALLTWMAGPMSRPLVRNYSNCAVAFLKLLQPTQAQLAAQAIPQLPTWKSSLDYPLPPTPFETQHGLLARSWTGSNPHLVIDDASSAPTLSVSVNEDAGASPVHQADFLLNANTQAEEDRGEPLIEEVSASQNGHNDDHRDSSGSGSRNSTHINASHWLSDSVNKVDTILRKHKAVSKIKTIGDVMMLAGPFREDGTERALVSSNTRTEHEEASERTTSPAGSQAGRYGGSVANNGDDTIQISVGADGGEDATNDEEMNIRSNPAQNKKKFRSIDNVHVDEDEVQFAVRKLVEVAHELEHVGGGVQCGVHCGPLVGAIQGTSRLCFDVFGDTVNVASRVLTGSAKIQTFRKFNNPPAVLGASPPTMSGENPTITKKDAAADTTGVAASFCSLSHAAKEALLKSHAQVVEEARAQAASGLGSPGAVYPAPPPAPALHEGTITAKGKGNLKVFFVMD